MTSTSYSSFLSTIHSTPDLDGGGAILAPLFAHALRRQHPDRTFNNCLEAFSGPAWIGLWLKHLNICKRLSVSDINPDALAAVQLTDPTIPCYKADALLALPVANCFDLIVANPPNYCNIQPTHPKGFMRDDLRASDLEWTAHRKFYSNIPLLLTPRGELWVSEINPFAREVHINDQLYDKRPIAPIMEFVEMLSTNNLELCGIHQTKLSPEITISLLQIKAQGAQADA